jgi:hypothetical protein
LYNNVLVREATSETTSKQEGTFDWTFAWQELRREQGVDTKSVVSDARFVYCCMYNSLFKRAQLSLLHQFGRAETVAVNCHHVYKVCTFTATRYNISLTINNGDLSEELVRDETAIQYKYLVVL